MFSDSFIAPSWRQRRVLLTSVVLHALLLAWIIHPPAPRRLMASSVALGRNGKAVTRLYWANQNPDDSSTISPSQATQVYRHQHLGHEKLTWRQSARPSNRALPLQQAPAEDEAKTAMLSKLGHGAAAGSPYGTLGRGPFSGDEVRPALPVATSDPVVYPWELPVSGGNEVIEITIDERGQIVNKTVLQSLGPDIDTKCLAALENWRFQPATRNGTAIPSKQDAVFPFRARG
ncbi:MAG TPA: TonB family protein [Candidatus Sulfotelmatobacter sp.]|nr:TonB family protein [Candidatus Sulfotelmatobacter sp.]